MTSTTNKFSIGTNVRLSPKGVSAGVSSVKTGTVTGFSRDKNLLQIKRNGLTTPVRFHPSFWELAND